MKKGFTLIELLAVIVILAIIALIATPIVLNIISETKQSSKLRGAQFYVDAVEQAVAREVIKNPTFNPSSCQIANDGNLLCNGEKVEVDIEGEVPTSGVLMFEEGNIIDTTLLFNDEILGKTNETIEYLESGLYDKDGKLIATWEELVNDYGIDIESDYATSFDENGDIVNISNSSGKIISANEVLKHGTKLVIDNSVKRIGISALSYNTTLTIIVIPDSVEIIERGAFYNSQNLKEILIGGNVETIGVVAFEFCLGLEQIIIPDGVISIGNSSFRNCKNLKSLKIGNSVTSIGNGAFYNCFNLSDVKLSNNVESIGGAAFHACSHLKEITLPKSLTKISGGIFSGCSSLMTINYEGTEAQWNSLDKGSNWDYGTLDSKVINYNYVIPQN